MDIDSEEWTAINQPMESSMNFYHDFGARYVDNTIDDAYWLASTLAHFLG